MVGARVVLLITNPVRAVDDCQTLFSLKMSGIKGAMQTLRYIASVQRKG